MSRFQVCIGPSANRAHIRDTRSNSKLVLCERTTFVRDLKGRISDDMICLTCLNRMCAEIKKSGNFGSVMVTAELLGCQEIL